MKTVVVIPFVALVRNLKDKMDQMKVAYTIYTKDSTNQELEQADLIIVQLEFIRHAVLKNFVAHLKETKRLSRVVIDEIHIIFTQRELRKIVNHLEEFVEDSKVLLLSATVPLVKVPEVASVLSIAEFQEIRDVSTLRRNIHHITFSCEDPDQYLRAALSFFRSIADEDDKVLIYTDTVENLHKLSGRYPEFAVFHGRQTPQEKQSNHEQFLQCKAIIATSAFGYGVDIANIKTVIFYWAIADIYTYQQGCGRAGRQSESSVNYAISVLKNGSSLDDTDYTSVAAVQDLFQGSICCSEVLSAVFDKDVKHCKAGGCLECSICNRDLRELVTSRLDDELVWEQEMEDIEQDFNWDDDTEVGVVLADDQNVGENRGLQFLTTLRRDYNDNMWMFIAKGTNIEKFTSHQHALRRLGIWCELEITDLLKSVTRDPDTCRYCYFPLESCSHSDSNNDCPLSEISSCMWTIMYLCQCPAETIQNTIAKGKALEMLGDIEERIDDVREFLLDFRATSTPFDLSILDRIEEKLSLDKFMKQGYDLRQLVVDSKLVSSNDTTPDQMTRKYTYTFGEGWGRVWNLICQVQNRIHTTVYAAGYCYKCWRRVRCATDCEKTGAGRILAVFIVMVYKRKAWSLLQRAGIPTDHKSLSQFVDFALSNRRNDKVLAEHLFNLFVNEALRRPTS